MLVRSALILAGVSLTVCPMLAFAYIDPGTGSALIQGLIAAIAAVGVTLKLYWHRLISLFHRSQTQPQDRPEENTPDGAD